jgi:transposase
MKARIALCDRHKIALENEIHTLINTTPNLKKRFEILTSIPNIGRITASTLLWYLPELGRLNAKEIAALAGVAPMNWDSGTKHGNRMIRGGRRSVRNALYMCAVSSISRSDPLGQSYRSLIRRGKNPKVALTAVMRKLTIIANTLIAEERLWSKHPPQGETC